jgi:hypothetical protein
MALLGARARKSFLTLHVLVSVGWFGAVAGFLAIATAGVISDDPITAAGTYVALDILVWTVIIPLSGVSLVSGVVQAVGTQWGLTRHYWVIAKLLLTAASTLVLLIHTTAIEAAAVASRHPAMDFTALRTQLVVDSAAALVVLALTTVLSVVKPRGITPWAARSARAEEISGGRES